MNVPEPSIDSLKNLKEVQSANHISVLPNSSPITVNCPCGLIDNRKLSEDEKWRNEIVKSNLLLTTHSRNTCCRCPICNQLTLTRREALLHLKTSHPETDAAHTKLPRIHLHRKKTCTNLINLTCRNELCESCWLDLVHANEIEGPDHACYFFFHMHCPFCNNTHRLDPEAAYFFYNLCNLPIPITEE